jgi:hypothetical protein
MPESGRRTVACHSMKHAFMRGDFSWVCILQGIMYYRSKLLHYNVLNQVVPPSHCVASWLQACIQSACWLHHELSPHNLQMQQHALLDPGTMHSGMMFTQSHQSY